MESIFQSAPLAVFCPPLIGKSNPKEEKPVGKDTRGRVFKSASKNNTCWFSVFDMIRDRIRAPNTDDWEARKFEKLVSQARKAITAHEDSLPDVTDQLNNVSLKRALSLVTKKTLALHLPILQQADQADPNTKVKLCPILPTFQAQTKCENLYDFLVDLKLSKRSEIYREFFEKLGESEEKLFAEFIKEDPVDYQVGRWDDLPDAAKGPYREVMARHLTARLFNIKKSSWNPSQPFERLVEEFDDKETKTKRPIAVGGCFGIPFHAPDEPLKLNDLTKEGRDVFHWKKKDNLKGLVSVHMILLIGAETIEGRHFVFYYDPMDPSDPLHPEKQRIFVMSYDLLKERICNLHGQLKNNSPPEVGYAYYYKS